MASEFYPPPDATDVFESLCLDLWRDLWDDDGAQKNGRSGQPQAGVDVFGTQEGRQMGVQCKQKSGLLRTQLTMKELEDEVDKARGFEPPLHTFILATTGPRNQKVQRRARELTQEHAAQGLFRVQVWSWQEIWDALYDREALLRRLKPKYWPHTHEPQRLASSRLSHIPTELFGRADDFQALDHAWADPATHVLTLVAWGGVGKTSLVATWAAGLTQDGTAYGGADYFDWSFYSQGTRDQSSASSDLFLAKALDFFGDPGMASSNQSPWAKGERLAELVAQRRTLLVLDGLEPLQYPPGPSRGRLKDQGIEALLKRLAVHNPGLCVVTTRESVADLAPYQGHTAPERRLSRLAVPAGVALLESLGVEGAPKELEKTVDEVAGHALTLGLLGRYLHEAHGGDVRRRDRIRLATAVEEATDNHAFRVIEAYEYWFHAEGKKGQRLLAVLRLLGLFDRPAPRECLDALLEPPGIPGLTEPLVDLGEDLWNLTVQRLVDSRLLVREGTALDAHPLVREYFAQQLQKDHPDAWTTAHGRLFDHLKDSVEHWPEGFGGLQPLYQAVVHGCLAGREQEACVEVYRDRILRGTGDDGFYSTRKLGAFGADLGAVACFFERPWTVVSSRLSEAAQAWFLVAAAFHLRALGRLREAVEPMRAGLPIEVAQEDWNNAARRVSNLSELELTLGDVDAAVRDAEQSVDFADRSGDAFMRMICRTTLADALYQAGRLDEGLERFEEAEGLQAKEQPQYPLLYSLPGFRYCDALLAEAESAAWDATVAARKSRLVAGGPSRRFSMGSSSSPRTGSEPILHSTASAAPSSHQNSATSRDTTGSAGNLPALRSICEAVEERVSKMFEWRGPNDPILDIALDHLTLARVRLYRTILDGHDLSPIQPDLERAVDGLRSAGAVQFLVQGLLTRAWFRALTDNPEGARADLDEAQDIAERGPMALHLVDIALHRGRLFDDPKSLDAGYRLAREIGYSRRLQDLP